MSDTKLDPAFVEAICCMVDFKGEQIRQAQAFLLCVGLTGRDITADMIPDSYLGGNIHLAGAATGGLLQTKLLTVVGRAKSQRPGAHGRKLNIFRIAPGKIETAKTWLMRHDYKLPPEIFGQMELAV